MNLSDQKAFFADKDNLDLEKYLLLEYYFETVVEPEQAAAHLCQEMSTAQWKRVDIDEDFRPRFGAKVITLSADTLLTPSSPYLMSLTPHDNGQFFSCLATIAYPYGNFGTKIPNLLTAVCGEGVFHAPDICAIRLIDIHFPESFLDDFQGPQFGVQGLRDLLEVYDRPLMFGVIKPNVGLPPEPFAQIAYEAWLGGLDVAKDDEQIGDVSWSSLDERSKLLGAARLRAEEATGDKKIYLANITDEVDRLLDLHDTAVANGANAVMLNAMTTGLSAARMVRRHAKVPMVSHFDLFGAMMQLPFHGIREVVFTKLLRLAGFDALVYPGFSPRMKTTEADILASVQACLDPMGSLKPCLPIPAGSQWAGSLKTLYDKLGTIDFGVVPGRAVFNHPMGPQGGAASLRQGWEAISKGIPLEEYAGNHPELRRAIEMQNH
jgi:ribulose-bisphosphate carboxylase large chain